MLQEFRGWCEPADGGQAAGVEHPYRYSDKPGNTDASTFRSLGHFMEPAAAGSSEAMRAYQRRSSAPCTFRRDGGRWMQASSLNETGPFANG